MVRPTTVLVKGKSFVCEFICSHLLRSELLLLCVSLNQWSSRAPHSSSFSFCSLTLEHRVRALTGE